MSSTSSDSEMNFDSEDSKIYHIAENPILLTAI